MSLQLDALDKDAISMIHAVVASDRHDTCREPMLEARRRVLATHNLFAIVDRGISGWKGTSAASTSARPTALSPLAGSP